MPLAFGSDRLCTRCKGMGAIAPKTKHRNERPAGTLEARIVLADLRRPNGPDLDRYPNGCIPCPRCNGTQLDHHSAPDPLPF